jgi:hypothetical protein
MCNQWWVTPGLLLLAAAGSRAEDSKKGPPSLKQDGERIQGLWYKVPAPKKALGPDKDDPVAVALDSVREDMVVRFHKGRLWVCRLTGKGLKSAVFHRYELAERKGKRFIVNEPRTAAIRYELAGDRLVLDAPPLENIVGTFKVKGEWRRAVAATGGGADLPPGRSKATLKEDEGRLQGLWYKLPAAKKAEGSGGKESGAKKGLKPEDPVVIRFHVGAMWVCRFRDNALSPTAVWYTLAEEDGRRLIRGEGGKVTIRYQLSGDRLVLDTPPLEEDKFDLKGGWTRAK